MDNKKTGRKAFCQNNCWICREIFVQLMDHYRFQKSFLMTTLLTRPQCYDIGVILFRFPAHCTHRLQSLDIQTRLRQNRHRFPNHWPFQQSLVEALTNAKHAFAKTGIYPYKDDIFKYCMFQPSSKTDKSINKEHQDDDQGQRSFFRRKALPHQCLVQRYPQPKFHICLRSVKTISKNCLHCHKLSLKLQTRD